VRRGFTVIAVAALLLCALGCSAFGRYVSNRVADLADVFVLEATYGPGLDVHAQATGYLGTALGYSEQSGVMLHGRRYGLGERVSAGFILAACTISSGEEMKCLGAETAMPDRFGFWAMLLPLVVSPAEGVYFGYAPTWPRSLDVEAGASAGVGLHVGVSPGELLDFVLGFTTLDLSHDDEREEHELESWGMLPPLFNLLQRRWRPFRIPPTLWGQPAQ